MQTTSSTVNPSHPWETVGFTARFQGFQKLMQFNIRNILLVSSLYDSYIIEEDGRLHELIRKEYEGLNLSHSPEITHVATGSEALEHVTGGRRFDLIIMTPHIEDMHVVKLAKEIREQGLNVPMVLLTYDNRELSELITYHDMSDFNRLFIWQGDSRILVAIIKYIEDRLNVEQDTRTVGVQSIILIEDSVRYYSAFLPLIYTELFRQSQRLISEGINTTDRFLRMRARPKILLCSTYEEAWDYFQKYKENVLGVISDIDFLRGGAHDPRAGIEFARHVKARLSDIPIVLQSTSPENQSDAHAIGASFLLKDSPTLLSDLRLFLNRYFSFGDFIFRKPDGTEVGRVNDLKSLEDQLHVVPDESVVYHSERNHFSTWLKARTEFWLAYKLRPRKVTDFPSAEALRQDLISSLQTYRRIRQLGQITDFDRSTFDPTSSFARIGGGSLGGKARGLGFMNTLINNFEITDRFRDVKIYVPPAVILGTDVFDQFLDENSLREFALTCPDDEEITRRFREAKKFPRKIRRQLTEFLELFKEPLAVRSSSLLEDSQFHPFAGVYKTHMIPNNHRTLAFRLGDLLDTIKTIYASMFWQNAKDYMTVASYRLEEEKMAVIIQKLVGARHDERFYPDFAGVAKSYNFYPVAPQTSTDGIVSAALGLGKLIVDGGETVRFCPKYPQHVLYASIKEAVRNSQSEFFALDLDAKPIRKSGSHDDLMKKWPLKVAEQDGTLFHVGSTYLRESDAIHDGLSRDGLRLVTLAPILKHKIFPLPEIIELLLDIGNWGMGAPVEIEFAVTMSVETGLPRDFGLLQIRPLVLGRETEQLDLGKLDRAQIVCQSHRVLGNGIVRDICDAIVVKPEGFDRSKTKDVAQEIGELNHKLVGERRPYLLIGMGRWGSLDPWLGIPVGWDQISGARAIVESGFLDMTVEPSQGSHFFQNITSFQVGYFTITSNDTEGFIDWKWLSEQPAVEERQYTRHLRFARPLVVRMNGRQNRGVILRPGEKEGESKGERGL